MIDNYSMHNEVLFRVVYEQLKWLLGCKLRVTVSVVTVF